MIVLLLVFVFLLWAIPAILFQPSNGREWSRDQQIPAYGKFEGDLVHLKKIRNFSYKSTAEYTPAWYDKTFDLNKIKSVDFVLELFDAFDGIAHTLFTFGFEGGEYVSISVEIRKEKGESYSPFWGALRQYELMYVIADENDVIKLRTNHRKDRVYLFPGNASKEKIRQLFVSMVRRANKLREHPEFYNTLTNTCTTNLVRHINEITEGRVPLSYKVLLPGYSDELAHQLGLIDTDLPYEKIREHFQIHERALSWGDRPGFSGAIRDRSTVNL